MEKSIEQILEEYKETVRYKAGLYFILGADRDDLIQEGMIGLVLAYNSFDESKGASFDTYANLCIDRNIINAIKSAARKKHSPLNSAVEIPEEEPSSSSSDPEDIAIYSDNLERITKNSDGLFSETEHKVLLMLMSGKTYTKIAEELGKTPKQIDNTIQRAKKKIERLLA